MCKSFYELDLQQQWHGKCVRYFSGAAADWNHARGS
jgi:uncharacterized protein YukE